MTIVNSREARKIAKFDAGDIVETGGVKFAVQEVLISVTHSDIKYKILWKHSSSYATIPEEHFTNAQKVCQMEERPYTWE